MKFLIKEQDTGRIDDYKGECPNCGGRTTFYHDIKCKTCNQTTITWCPACEEHVELQL